ncbi:MAG TPA: asparagine synthase (glutamine-hydrolyzing) [Gemmatimonadota bacterium]|jgi:asparagine synthase (glutamine-hydrolysing)
MCGICGIATRGRAPDPAILRQMCRTLAHRGPDGEGIHVAPGVGLGMRRLAIIDVEGGWQPMGNETGEVQIVFNGEIYNFAALRDGLEAKGHRFRTRSDTEVIPHLYEELGPDFARELNGIFAIALWDAPRRRLLLVRDRMGIKPLFWAVRDGVLTFGSEVKSILAADGSRRELDLAGLDQLLTFEYTASPWTLLADVKKLPPGGWLTWTEGEVRQGSFWSLDDAVSGDDRDAESSPAEWAARLRETFDRAVERQMVSDVPLGSFLSGGIDSSILVSAMSRASDRPVKTFSIGFRDQSYDELPFARLVARHCGTEHRETVLDPSYRDLLEEVVHHMDQPIADFSVFPTLLVSKVARREVTVVLAGDGGDELFAGYDAYQADRLARWTVDLLPDSARRGLARLGRLLPPSTAKRGLRNTLPRFLEGAALPRAWEHMRWMTFLSPEQRRALYPPDVHAALERQCGELILAYLDNAGGDRLQRQLFCDTRFYLPENILVKVDLMGMAASIETRVPYLDNEMLDLVARMPSALKLRNGERKHILKRAYADALPPAILRRGKQGFSIPLKTWLTGEWNDLLHDLLSESALTREGLFDPATVGRWVREHEEGRANHSHVLWALMVFQLWKRAFLAPASAVAAPARVAPRDVVPRFDPAAAALREASP